jgi:hypothetical protein
MNCQKFETIVGELARNQMMEAEVRSEALAHSADCSVCSTRLRNEETLTRGLRALTTKMNSIEAPPAVEARLLDAFRKPEVVVPLPVAQRHSRYWLAAVAALLLIVFGVLAVRLRIEQQRVPQQQQAIVEPVEPKKNIVDVNQKEAPKPEPVTAVNNEQPRNKPRHRFMNASVVASAGNSRATKNNVVSNHATEVATEFMPIGYLNPAALQDGGQIVRVEVSRTTLASFGIPVNMDRYNEKVKADVLLGVDGMAHAIRFVQEKKLQ